MDLRGSIKKKNFLVWELIKSNLRLLNYITESVYYITDEYLIKIDTFQVVIFFLKCKIVLTSVLCFAPHTRGRHAWAKDCYRIAGGLQSQSHNLCCTGPRTTRVSILHSCRKKERKKQWASVNLGKKWWVRAHILSWDTEILFSQLHCRIW